MELPDGTTLGLKKSQSGVAHRPTLWTEKWDRTGLHQVATEATVQILLSIKVYGSVSSGGFLESFCFSRPLFEKSLCFIIDLFYLSIFKSMLPLANLLDVQ